MCVLGSYTIVETLSPVAFHFLGASAPRDPFYEAVVLFQERPRYRPTDSGPFSHSFQLRATFSFPKPSVEQWEVSRQG